MTLFAATASSVLSLTTFTRNSRTPAATMGAAAAPRGAGQHSSRAAIFSSSLCFLLHLFATVRSQLVGPGGMVPYGSGGGGRRVSYGVVRDASKGFFVGGSAIEDLNGVYERVGGLPRNSKHVGIHYKDGSLTYLNEATGWFMAMVDASPDDGQDPGVDPMTGEPKRKIASRTEWVFIDENGKDRFWHEGETILPGSGTSWKHKPAKSAGERGAFADIFDDIFPVATAEDNFVDLDELPWQVIGVMDPDMLHRLKYHKRYHQHTIKRALSGGDLPQLAGHSGNGFVSFDIEMPKVLEKYFDVRNIFRVTDNSNFGENGELLEQSAQQLQQPKEVDEVLTKKIEIDESLHVFTKANVEVLEKVRDLILKIRTEIQEKPTSFYEDVNDILEQFLKDNEGVLQFEANRNRLILYAWIEAGILKLQSFFLRRVNSLTDPAKLSKEAKGKVEKALAMFPRWNAGLLENAMVQFDLGEPGRARHFLEQILRSNRKYPELFSWLLIAHTHDKRQWEAQVEYPAPKFGGLLTDEKEKSNFDDEKSSDSSRGSSGNKLKKIENPQQFLREKSNYYRLLAVPVDLLSPVEDEFLKKQYRQLSKATHPDKHGIEYKELFQKIAKGYETLQSTQKRPEYDDGQDLSDLKAQHQVEDEDGHKTKTLKEEVSENYFPEKHGFHPFGDPFERKKHEGYGDSYTGYKKTKNPEEYTEKTPVRYAFPLFQTGGNDNPDLERRAEL
ncbi:unnamed protein product [Amoebophrya sp. A120]|nr:unnamed protein product [Amoebophrya sp. A120]|eukprot:GSA120T00019426001.1